MNNAPSKLISFDSRPASVAWVRPALTKTGSTHPSPARKRYRRRSQSSFNGAPTINEVHAPTACALLQSP
jgi:hypothetical protein